MARANRHHIPGQVWHITHRWHKKEFLLKFARDRRRWHSWLFEAKKRFGLRGDQWGQTNGVRLDFLFIGGMIQNNLLTI